MKIINYFKKYKSLALLFVFVFGLILTLYACNQGESGSNDNNNAGSENLDNTNTPDGNNEEIIPNDNAVWGKGINLRVVIKDGSNFDVGNIISSVSSVTDTPALLVTDIIDAAEHEFIFGKTSRQLSDLAYAELDKLLVNDYDDGWILYAKDNSLALAYSSDNALNMAMEYIKNELVYTEELVFSSKGVVKKNIYDLVEYANAEREELRNNAFNNFENILGKESADELKKLYELYTPELYSWFAGLYDKNIGGFYYSNSGRDNYGYLPDIESTVQALNHLASGGLFANYDGSYAKALPKEMKSALLNFAKSLQSSKDGYFYHPQWGEAIIVARRGRDLGWATSLISALGGRPYWTTPGGVVGEYGSPGVTSSSALTKKLSYSTVSAVSAVKASSSYLPEHLRSLDAWKTYIDELNIYKDPYTSGNTLSAQHNEIKKAGKEYIDYLTSYLTDLQNKETGFWGEGITYVTMNGFMKLSYSYSYYGRTVPNVEAALHSTIQILLTPDTAAKDLHICNTYNTWVNFVQILNSAKQTDGAEKVNELRSILREKAPELIKITYEKVATHKRAEGGFSYFEHATANASQKAPVACAKTPESDVNATAIAVTGITSNMFSALGIKKVPIYCATDYEIFIRMIENSPEIIKTSENFEFPTINGERGNGAYYEKANKYEGTAAPTVSTVSSKTIISNTTDKYVYFYKSLKDGITNVQDTVNFTLPDTKPQNAVGITLEADFALGNFSDFTSQNKIAGMQINLYDGIEVSSVYFVYENGKVKTVWSTVLDGENLSLNENEWYNLRFESYVYENTRAIKIYVNGEYRCTLKSADDKASTYKKVSIVLRQYDENDWVAFDNVYVGYHE